MDTSMSAMQLTRRLIPQLTHSVRKGQQGRVGVVGGSFEYTGAPFYSGLSSLKTGADLCQIFCVEEAATPIKTYSPELIVHPLLRSEKSMEKVEENDRGKVFEDAAERVRQIFSRLDTLVMGCGLGRDASVQSIAKLIILKAKEINLPLILDGDALFLLSNEPELVQNYDQAILTPNSMEYARLCKAVGLLDEADPNKAAEIEAADLSKAMGYPVILKKGKADTISDGKTTLTNDQYGSPRRCGGQGDVLTGTTATFAAWAQHVDISKDDFQGNPLMLAAYGGSVLTRASSETAFNKVRRAMTSPDVVHSIGETFERVFPEESK